MVVYWGPQAQPGFYLMRIDGIAIESVFYLAHDNQPSMGCVKKKPFKMRSQIGDWKTCLGVVGLLQRNLSPLVDGYQRNEQSGFIPYVSRCRVEQDYP